MPASYRALTSARDPAALRARIRQVVIDYVAFGLDPEKTNIYLQHDVPEVTELAWLLSCVCPMGFMDKAVSYKDKVAKGLTPNVGLYTYPILQAADILAVDADVVPVGKDQVGTSRSPGTSRNTSTRPFRVTSSSCRRTAS